MFDDTDLHTTIEANDSITAICLSKDSRFLLCNVSMTKPRIEYWELAKNECSKKFRGHEQRNYVLKP